MFQQKTVFILGAGSSHEAGLPLGRTLASTISKLVNFKFEHGLTMISGDSDLFEIISRQFPSNRNEYRKAGAFIASGIQLADSIDDFLSLHQSDEKIIFVGKLGIAKAILGAEHGNALYPRGLPGQQAIDFLKLGDTWYVKLLKLLSREIPKEDLDKIFANVSFVNFNYDRCLEFFLCTGLEKLYGLDVQRAAELVAKVKIFRPYGSVGPLKIGTRQSGIQFGDTSANLLEAAGRIKTYSEKIDENDDLTSMRKEIAAAKLIIFLGMRFHEQNLKLIAPTSRTSAENIFATAHNFSDEDRSVVEDQLAVFLATKLRGGNFLQGETPIRVQSLKSSELFDRYSKTLSRPKTPEPIKFGVDPIKF